MELSILIIIVLMIGIIVGIKIGIRERDKYWIKKIQERTKIIAAENEKLKKRQIELEEKIKRKQERING